MVVLSGSMVPTCKSDTHILQQAEQYSFIASTPTIHFLNTALVNMLLNQTHFGSGLTYLCGQISSEVATLSVSEQHCI